LQYLDWQGSGPALILIHGAADDPHVFDDLAPAFIDRFHVIAYARRGSGASDARGPYDVATLTQDLLELMDALGIAKAALVGHSAGGNEVTEMASLHPERVDRVVYLDAAHNYADPSYQAAHATIPPAVFDEPASAMASLEAFRSFQKAIWYPELDHLGRLEAYLRAKVTLQPDGRVRDRVPKEVRDAIWSGMLAGKPRDYTRVHCPALAIFAQYALDVHVADPHRRADAIAWEQRYWGPFQAKSAAQIERELPGVEIVQIPDSRHVSFFLTHRVQVVSVMRRFLGAEP